MKTTNQLLFLLAVMSLMACKKSAKAEHLKDTRVILMVDTESILEAEYPISDDKLKGWVYFIGDSGEKPGNGKNFDSKIYKSKKIIWLGIQDIAKYYKATDTDDYLEAYEENTIAIKRMKKINGPSLLKKDEYEDKNGKGVVVGHVKKNYKDGIEEYSLTFLINDDEQKPYTIDPKMHMH